jgi:HlyD family secretion protein
MLRTLSANGRRGWLSVRGNLALQPRLFKGTDPDALHLNRRQVIALVVLAVLIAGAAAGANVVLRPIQVVVAQAQSNVAVQVFGLGTVEARVLSKVGFKVSGILVDLQADQGNFVQKGKVLARLDAQEQEARVSKAAAAVEQAAASLQKAKADVDRAQASLTNTEYISARRQALVTKGTVSVESAQTAEATMRSALADLAVAKAAVQVADAALKDAKAQQQLDSATLGLYALTSPYDALVTSRQRELGSMLVPGEPVFSLIDPQAVWVLAYIDESKAGGIAVNAPTEIVLRSRPDQPLSGRVARIQIESDRVNEERRVEILFDRLPKDFHLGEQAEVHITVSQLDKAVLVPEVAISNSKGNRGTIWTVEDTRLERREVSLGHRTLDGRVEIAGGLPEGASAVIDLVSGLRVGRAAMPVAGVVR